MYSSGMKVDPNDPTNEIWDNVYICRLPLEATISDYELSNFGIRTTGIKQLDVDNYNSLATVGLTIDKMVELFRKGVVIRLTTREDTVKVYLTIQRYIGVFTRKMNDFTLNHHAYPMDDLKLMDELAGTIYNMASLSIEKERREDTPDLFDLLNAGNDSGKILVQAYEEGVDLKTNGRVSFDDYLEGSEL